MYNIKSPIRSSYSLITLSPTQLGSIGNLAMAWSPLVEEFEGFVCPGGNQLCSWQSQKLSVIPYMFDCCADPAVNLILQSSMAKAIKLTLTSLTVS